MDKAIFILLDACGYDIATEYGGYLEHLVNQGMGAKYKIKGELPTFSKPMYATLFTGVTVDKHGVAANLYQGMCEVENIFSLCKKQKKTTAAAAYWWMSQLYNKKEFDFFRDRFQINTGIGNIDYGIFYFEDVYPDSHLLMDGEYLRKAYEPDFLLIHSMNIDLQGHLHGSASRQYAEAVQDMTENVAHLIPRWLEAGYQVVVTADHGMDLVGLHGGTSDIQRYVPLYVYGNRFASGRFEEDSISHLSLAPMLAKCLNIKPSKLMQKNLEVNMK